MKFSTREDIGAPAAAVFAAVTDFGAFTRMALRRGVEVKRQDSLTAPGAGMAWAVRARVRGRPRDIALRVTDWHEGQSVTLAIESGGMTGTFGAELVALSRGLTRLHVALDLRAVTMTARLILHSARLGKGSLDRRFAKRVAEFAREIEAKQQKAARTV